MEENGTQKPGAKLLRRIWEFGDPKHPATSLCSQSNLFSPSDEAFIILHKYDETALPEGSTWKGKANFIQ